MRYQFPRIYSIGDVLPAIQGRDEFVVAERDWGTVIDYQITLPDSFPCPATEASGTQATFQAAIRRECRGIKFDRDGRLIARPYHKFFNVGEKHETQTATLRDEGRLDHTIRVFPKLDGSMIHPILWDGEVWFCTRMGITDVADQAMQFVGDLHYPGYIEDRKWYLDFCYDLLCRGITPIFEWCSRKQRIVIDYPDEALTLTAIRMNETGEYLTPGKMRALAEPYKIPMLGPTGGITFGGFEAFAEDIREAEGIEGVVIRWDDGHMSKMKGEWYVTIHRAKDSIAHEKRIIAMILNDDMDDVLPHLLPEDYNRLIQYRADFWAKIDECVKTLASVVSINQEMPKAMGLFDEDRQPEGAREAKRMFATSVIPGYKGHLSLWKGLLFAVWDGADPRETIINYLRKQFALDVPGAKNNGSQSLVDELRAGLMLPERDWRDYDGRE